MVNTILMKYHYIIVIIQIIIYIIYVGRNYNLRVQFGDLSTKLTKEWISSNEL